MTTLNKKSVMATNHIISGDWSKTPQRMKLILLPAQPHQSHPQPLVPLIGWHRHRQQQRPARWFRPSLAQPRQPPGQPIRAAAHEAEKQAELQKQTHFVPQPTKKTALKSAQKYI